MSESLDGLSRAATLQNARGAVLVAFGSPGDEAVAVGLNGPASTATASVIVAFGSEKASDAFVSQAANHVSGSTLPADHSFYDSADNYLLGWLACRLIAQKYGQPKLLALYDWFKDHNDEDGGFRAVLGTTRSAFLSAWQNYMRTVRAG